MGELSKATYKILKKLCLTAARLVDAVEADALNAAATPLAFLASWFADDKLLSVSGLFIILASVWVKIFTKKESKKLEIET